MNQANNLKKAKELIKLPVILLAVLVVLGLGMYTIRSARAHPGTIQVDKNDAGCVTGTGQPDPYSVVYCNIKDAVDDAIANDTINVAAGTYTGSGNKNIDFAGKALTLQSVSGQESTIIDCENSGHGFRFYSGEGTDSVVDGFTITGGSITEGGGIYCMNSSNPTLINLIITENTAFSAGAAGLGGGIYCNNSSPTLTNVIISGNTADSGYGGGIYCDNSSPILTNVTISGNTADKGGGIYCGVNSDPILTNVILWDDSATQGNEIYLGDDTSDPVISYSCVEGGEGGIAGPGAGGNYSGWGVGNINSDPLFTPSGDYYLSQTAAGQASDSPCVNTGSDSSGNICFSPTCMSDLTTRTDEVADTGQVDMGYHYPISGAEGAIPEFTTITLIIAAVAGFGIYLLIRRKNTRKTQKA